ncbi:MAG: hypothetical protein ACOZAA_14590 [Pseudomonadota bacterium]
MADGASSHSIRRSAHGSHGGHGGAPAAGHGDHGSAGYGGGGLGHGHGPERPRVAFTGEEFGFGYQAAEVFAGKGRSRPIYDAGLAVAKARTEQEFRLYADRYEGGENKKFDFSATTWQPLRTKEQALMAVKQHTADFAVVPFYHPYFGYDFESLRALGSLIFLLGVEQVEATDNFCLAVHESQLYDLIQSAHPGTGFSALQRRFRKSWGAIDNGSGNAPSTRLDAEMPRAGLPIDMSDQKLIRDRIDVVFAGPEAARRCKSKLDGLRSIGVDVQETAAMIEPHRELARRARATANSTRQTNTFFDPVSGETRFFSSLGAEAQGTRLFGMVLPYEVAMRSSDYVIVDHNYDDGPAAKTRFMAVEANPDHTLLEDAYRTTDQKTRYWYRRLSALSMAPASLETKGVRTVGALGMAAGLAMIALGVMNFMGYATPAALQSIAASLPGAAPAFILAGAAVAAFGFLLTQTQGGAKQGVRVMLRFLRNNSAASIGDVENYLRNHGVRHAVVRTDEDSEGHEPAPVILDVEFAPEDFAFNPLMTFGRRLQNSVVNGALKKAFARWKNRGVLVIAAMPIEHGAYQMPEPKKRRWWNEALGAWLADAVETWVAIRLPRILVYYLLPAALAVYAFWALLGGGK